jgi:hypothetical protein
MRLQVWTLEPGEGCRSRILSMCAADADVDVDDPSSSSPSKFQERRALILDLNALRSGCGRSQRTACIADQRPGYFHADSLFHHCKLTFSQLQTRSHGSSLDAKPGQVSRDIEIPS